MGDIKSILESLYKDIELNYDNKVTIAGRASGLTDLDKMTGGFSPGQMIVVAGRPGTGKSAFLESVLVNWACYENVPVALICPARSGKDVLLRMMAGESRVSYSKLASGDFRESDWSGVTIANGVLSGAQLWIDDSYHVTLADLRDQVEALVKNHGVQLVALDGVQSLSSGGYVEGGRDESWPVAVARDLRVMTREHSIVSLCSTQLRSWSYTTAGIVDDGTPRISDLAAWYPMHQVADVLVMLDGKRQEEELYAMEAVVAKNNNGPTGGIRFGYRPEHFRFKDLVRYDE